ncbi:unnamed protein product [Cuscuta campestris]|uniref:rRNA N-glycosylase n=1 Tax=Cuscuta campestris TaxID=132261 RepID=A0A484MHA2_9ASTE|nr:unnamed protein product [Cuscuta campestris]
MIGAVDSIASPWHVDDNGIAIISQSKAKSAVVLIQMISEAIRFHTVLDTLAGLDVFYPTFTAKFGLIRTDGPKLGKIYLKI